MDFKKLVDIAADLSLIDLVAKGSRLATDLANYADEVRENAARAGVVMAEGTREDLDAIHAEALELSSRLDAKLAEAATR